MSDAAPQSPLLPITYYRRASDRRAIPRDPSPERSLERRPMQELLRFADLLGRERATWHGKDALVRALAHVLRDPHILRQLFHCFGNADTLAFLAQLVLEPRMRLEALPPPVLPGFVEVPGSSSHPGRNGRWLHEYALVHFGRVKGGHAVYLPADLRRPYAEALLAMEPPVADASIRRRLEALVAQTPPPVAPVAPGLPTGRARRRLATPGPDRILELHVFLESLDVPVWRRLLVSYQRSLGALHEILRIAFAWPQRGRHWFYDRGRHAAWGPPGRLLGERPTNDEWKAPLRDVLGGRGARAIYVIDPPTHWVHQIVTRAVHAPSLVPGEPLVLEAEGVRPPPEFGRPENYGSFVASWRRGQRGIWFPDLVDPHFDPDAAVDIAAVNRRLEAFG